MFRIACSSIIVRSAWIVGVACVCVACVGCYTKVAKHEKSISFQKMTGADLLQAEFYENSSGELRAAYVFVVPKGRLLPKVAISRDSDMFSVKVNGDVVRDWRTVDCVLIHNQCGADEVIITTTKPERLRQILNDVRSGAVGSIAELKCGQEKGARKDP